MALRKSAVINERVTSLNDAVAAEIESSLKTGGIMSVNIMGSPGSGKTTVIEHLAGHLGADSLAVIQGDLESDVDQRRLTAKGIYCHQINTHSGCHLNASMIRDALQNMTLSNRRYLLIENVGNLVCPANKKIGQMLNVLVSSTTEGSDKPRKYPIIFLCSRIIVLSKIDLAPAVEFDEESYIAEIKKINPEAAVVKASSRTPGSFKALAECIESIRNHAFD